MLYESQISIIFTAIHRKVRHLRRIARFLHCNLSDDIENRTMGPHAKLFKTYITHRNSQHSAYELKIMWKMFTVKPQRLKKKAKASWYLLRKSYGHVRIGRH